MKRISLMNNALIYHCIIEEPFTTLTDYNRNNYLIVFGKTNVY